MSRQRPRNPRYFPKMKVRGARRRRVAAFQRIAGAFDRLQGDATRASESLERLSKELVLPGWAVIPHGLAVLERLANKKKETTE